MNTIKMYPNDILPGGASVGADRKKEKMAKMKLFVRTYFDGSFAQVKGKMDRFGAELPWLGALHGECVEAMDLEDCVRADGTVDNENLVNRLVLVFKIVQKKLEADDPVLEKIERTMEGKEVRNEILSEIHVSLVAIAKKNVVLTLLIEWLGMEGLIPACEIKNSYAEGLRPSQRCPDVFSTPEAVPGNGQSVLAVKTADVISGMESRPLDEEPAAEPAIIEKASASTPPHRTSFNPPPPNEGVQKVEFLDENGLQNKALSQFRPILMKELEARISEKLNCKAGDENCHANALQEIGEHTHTVLFTKSEDYRQYYLRKAGGSKDLSKEAFIGMMAIKVLETEANNWVRSFLERLIKYTIEKKKDEENLLNLEEEELREKCLALSRGIYFGIRNTLKDKIHGAQVCSMIYYFQENRRELSEVLYDRIHELLMIEVDLTKKRSVNAARKVRELSREVRGVLISPVLPVEGLMTKIEEPKPAPAAEAAGELTVQTAEMTADEERKLIDLLADDEDDEDKADAVTSIMYQRPKTVPPKTAGVKLEDSRILINGIIPAQKRPEQELIIRYDDGGDITPEAEIRIVDGKTMVVPIIRPAAGTKPEAPEVALEVKYEEAPDLLIDEPEADEPKADEPEAPVDRDRQEPDEEPAEDENLARAKAAKRLGTIKSWFIGAGAALATLAAGYGIYNANQADEDHRPTASASVSGAASGGSLAKLTTNTSLTSPTQNKSTPVIKTPAGPKQETRTMPVSAEMSKIPRDQKLARSLIEHGKYPEGFAQKDHASKLLFIFGQNLTDSERVQVNGLRDQYNRGAYADAIDTFRGKSNAEMWSINNNPGHPLHRQLVNAQQSLGEKDWNKWSWEVKKLTKEGGKLAYKKMPYEQAYAEDMAFYRQCRGEFVQAGLYGSNATVEGRMTTFAERLLTIRGWQNTASPAAEKIPAPPVNLINTPANEAPIDLDLDQIMDGGTDNSGVNDASLGFNGRNTGVKAATAINTAAPKSSFGYSAEELDEIDSGWDAADDEAIEITEADFEEVDGQEVLSAADVIDERIVLTEADFEEVNGQEVLSAADVISYTRARIAEQNDEEIELGDDDIIWAA